MMHIVGDMLCSVRLGGLPDMSAELIGILSVGVALGGLVLASQARTDKRLDALQARTDKRLDALQAELRRLGERVARLEERAARLEGLIEGAGLFRPAEALAPASTGD